MFWSVSQESACLFVFHVSFLVWLDLWWRLGKSYCFWQVDFQGDIKLKVHLGTFIKGKRSYVIKLITRDYAVIV